MAAKRFINQDPEYDPIPVEIQEKRMKCIERDARNATVKKIECILRSQFSAEINNKAKEVDTIDDMLYEARQMIDRLRAQIVMKYYCDAGSSKDAKSDETAVPSIHPTVKENLIGKSPKYMHPSSDSSAVKTEALTLSSTSATDSTVAVQNYSSVSASEKSLEVAKFKSETTKDDEIPSRMPRMKTKCNVIVGNVSKFLPAHLRDEDDQFTHKWMVYVRGDKDSPSLDSIVKKVCFLLHASYRPNDIVEVCNPPFHLVKRGWGEFQIRVQLHFKDPRNKPVDLLHLLRLDKTFTGLQTLGAETVFELMLYKTEDKAAPKSIAIQSSPGPSLIQQAVPVNVNKITPAIPNVSGTNNEVVKNNPVVVNTILPPEKVKKEKDELPSSNNTPNIVSPSKSSVSPLKNMEISKSHQSVQSLSKAATSSLVDKPKSPVILSKQSPLSKSLRTINPAAKNQITNGVGTFIKCTDSQGRILLVPQTSLICMSSVNNNAVIKPFTVTQTVVQPQCTQNAELGKSILQSVPPSPVSSNAKLPSYVLKVIPTVQSRPNQVLLIPVSEGTQKTQAATPSYVTNNAPSAASGKSFHQSSTSTVITPPSPVKKTKPLLHWEQVMEGLRIESYGSFMEILKKMMKIFPLISQDYDPASIPFCAPSVEVFQSWNIGKQRAAEWQRAGMVRSATLKLLKTQQNSCLKPDDVWSRGQIMVWCRKNGYTPPLRAKSSSAPIDAHVGPALNEISTISDGKSIISSLESQNSISEVTEEDEEVDIITVDNEDEIKKKKKQSLNHCPKDCIPPSSPSVYFVKDSAAEIGVKLSPVEVEPSIFMPVIEEMIHSACREFASDLVRASLMQGYQRVGGKSSPEEITVQDVFCALQNTSTFDFITNKHLGVLQEQLDQS